MENIKAVKVGNEYEITYGACKFFGKTTKACEAALRNFLARCASHAGD